MKRFDGFMMLEAIISLSVLLVVVVLIGPLVLQMHVVRERIFKQCEHMMHNHVVIAQMMHDINQGPAQEGQWWCDDHMVSWQGDVSHVWKLRGHRLWFYEGGFGSPVCDGIIACVMHLVVKKGLVRGLWINLEHRDSNIQWYVSVHEGLQ